MERYKFSQQEQHILEHLQQPFAVYQFVDSRVVTLVISDGFCRLFGYTNRDEAYDDMDHNMYKNDHPDDVARIADAAYRFATEGGKYEVIYRTRKKNSAEYMIVHAVGEHVIRDGGVLLAHVWYTDEGTYQAEIGPDGSGFSHALDKALSDDRAQSAKQFDSLTGLPNMTYFFELARDGMDEMRGKGGAPALLYLDLSGMKYFNRKYSFAEGDKLIRSFAELLIQTFYSENCCHTSGDHFVVLADENGLEGKLYRMFIEWRGMNDGKTLPIHVGIYPTRLENVEISAAYDRAKIACDELNGTYASVFNYYNISLSEDVEKQQHVLENIDRAIREGWIQVYYQPIVRAVNSMVCDVEALARWIDPEKGFLSPTEFIPYLEEAELIYKLDLYVLEQVLWKMNTQAETGLYIVPHSINLSRSDFNACDIVEEIRRRVDDAGIARDRITIEITESVIGSDLAFMSEQINRFRSLGFPVWMDDFGSGYSSLDVLQSLKFDLIKFDMSFMRKLDEGVNGKIILTELMKMATALGVDTVCEGVETEAQVRFLQEIGCSKLQGYFFSRPVPYSDVEKRHQDNDLIANENPEESAYYDTISRVNLNDLTIAASEDRNAFHNLFNTIPMGILEVRDSRVRIIRSTQSYIDFIHRFFKVTVPATEREFREFIPNTSASFIKQINQCCTQGIRIFHDQQMPDGSMAHMFIRRIASNPVTGTNAVAVAVLSVTEPDEGTTYANIARALAADYYNIYVVNLETDSYIEYSSQAGVEELAVERHGEDFFESSKRDSYRIYEEDRKTFYEAFSKENIIKALDQQGVFTATYRLMDTGKPVYVNMKVTRMQPDGKRIIMGISIIDAQMKQKARLEEMQRERDTLIRVMALSDGYLSLYMVDPKTGQYVMCSASDDYAALGSAKEGEDFFRQSMLDVPKVVHPDDLPRFFEQFTEANVMSQVRNQGFFRMYYRLKIGGEYKMVSLKAALFRDGNEDKLAIGVRARLERKNAY